MKISLLKLFLILGLVLSCSQAHAWFDKTHLAVAKAGGLQSWYNAAGPDLAKIKAGNKESYNHWFNNDARAEVTSRMVFDQIPRYNRGDKARDAEGHLYGAIIASFRAYGKARHAGKYAEYHLAFCAHYIADLSQPLHNIPFDSFNRTYHDINDGIVNSSILEEPQKLSRHLYVITLRRDRFEADLAREIARVANISRRLGYKLRAEKRAITKEEAYVQLGHSVSLLKAVLRHTP